MSRLQGLALRARRVPGLSVLFLAYYSIAQATVVGYVRLISRSKNLVVGIYLRRGGGRDEIVPVASDLDFFLVLGPLSAEREMEFLKTFWRGYRLLRKLFPVLGEVLMGDESELIHWLRLPTVRSYEARFSWKPLWGPDLRNLAGHAKAPDLRDIFSESLRHYWDLLQPVLKLRSDNFHSEISEYSRAAIQLRHGAKALIDLFRLHHILQVEESSHSQLWAATRLELLDLLPAAHYPGLNKLRPILTLERPLLTDNPLKLFSEYLHTSCLCLDDLAQALRKKGAASEKNWTISPPAQTSPSDPYSFSVRELFAERLLLRHRPGLSLAVLAENSSQMYLVFPSRPEQETFGALIADLREVSFSFDRFSVAMPLTESTFAELERSSVLDSPFHSFQGHREVKLEGEKITSQRHSGKTDFPVSAIHKSFAELSFALRLQPIELEDFLERMVNLVLGLRMASEHQEISASFYDTLKRYAERYPLRGQQLQSKIAPFLPGIESAENDLWEEIFLILKSRKFPRASALRSQLESMRLETSRIPLSKSLPTDIWINLTPFLRMEMNTMKERFFENRPPLKL